MPLLRFIHFVSTESVLLVPKSVECYKAVSFTHFRTQVNASAQFCGVAEMIGPVDFDKSVEYWLQDKWTGQFPVKWHIIKDVPNSQFRHILLENNDNKPVTNSRDTQEVKFTPNHVITWFSTSQLNFSRLNA